MRARLVPERVIARAAVIVALAAVAGARPAPGQRLYYTGGAQAASGDYIFAEATTTASISNGLVFAAGPLTLSGSIPLLYQSTPWISQSGIGGIPTGGPQAGDTHGRGQPTPALVPAGVRYYLGRGSVSLSDTASYDQFGVGDPTAFASLQVIGGDEAGPTLGLTGGIKAPVASVSSGFGTGEWDYGAGASATLPLGPVVLGADAMKWWLGDMPDVVIQDPVTFGASLTMYGAEQRHAFFATFWGSSRTFSDTDAPATAGLGWCRMEAGVCAFGITANAGLSSASPDFSVGMSWQVPLGR